MPDSLTIFWFRRDLRLDDNAGLYRALKAGGPVLPVFIFDSNILDSLSDRADKRVNFIHDTIAALHNKLQMTGSSLYTFYGTPLSCFKQLAGQYPIEAVYTNTDYEPYAIQRDKEITAFLQGKNISFHSFKDQVIFEQDEVVKDNIEPYTVFTPYSRKWKEKLNSFYLKEYPVERYFNNLCKHNERALLTLKEIGFSKAAYDVPPAMLDEGIALHYDETRDYPAVKGTTMLSLHLRFGTISIRRLAAKAVELNGTYLNELIWREFYQMILWHFPHVVTGCFKPAYDRIEWRNNEVEFEKWCTGQTGYPIVDAGMRQLNATGYMHNRVRMVTASFLTKHLLIDWRWGEGYFAEKLLDYDLAANNGGWQWAAGCGCDAAPYFRIFNPYLQTQKFDPQATYIKKWVPEYDQFTYPLPMVEHSAARERCLRIYKKELG